MFEFNVQSSVAAAHIAANSLKEGGLLVLTGADAAIGPTPLMIAYGITKARPPLFAPLLHNLAMLTLALLSHARTRARARAHTHTKGCHSPFDREPRPREQWAAQGINCGGDSPDMLGYAHQ